MNSLVRGAVAGTAATGPMTLAMKLIHRSLPWRQRKEPIPPRQITERAAASVGMDKTMGRSGHQAATAVSHFAYGAACGALYAPLAKRTPGPPLAKGIGFGLLVWAVSYLAWLPAFGVLPSATKWPKGRNLMMILSHVVWGAALGMFVDRAQRGKEFAR